MRYIKIGFQNLHGFRGKQFFGICRFCDQWDTALPAQVGEQRTC